MTKHWIWLSMLSGISTADKILLLDKYSTAEMIYDTPDEELAEVSGVKIKHKLDRNLDAASKSLWDCDDIGATIVTIADATYPIRLRNIPDPPIVLFVLGKLPPIDELPSIGLVGTRKCTPYGLITAESYGYEIACCGGLLVSGLAEGIDSAGARGAIRGGGRVIGVLGTGIDIVFPSFNKPLFEDVQVCGAIVSEYPPGFRGQRYTFPRRNRIISGLSLGIIVVEAPRKSGSLITVTHATQQGRDVFCAPANLDAESFSGSKDLIASGVPVLVSGHDIINIYRPMFPNLPAQPETLTPLPEDLESELIKSSLKPAGKPSAWAAKSNPDTAAAKPEPPAPPVNEAPAPAEPKTQPRPAAKPKKDMKNAAESKSKPDNSNSKNNGEPSYTRVYTAEQKIILDILDKAQGSLHIDEIVRLSGLRVNVVLATATLLQLMGAIDQRPGKNFTIIRNE